MCRSIFNVNIINSNKGNLNIMSNSVRYKKYEQNFRESGGQKLLVNLNKSTKKNLIKMVLKMKADSKKSFIEELIANKINEYKNEEILMH